MTEAEAAALLARYTTRTRSVEIRPGAWKYLEVEVLLDGKPAGEYTRNYPNLFNTFVPFVQEDGGVYALYSPKYTATRLMRLPECEDIGGEEQHAAGFCPTGYYVPYRPDRGLVGAWGFVSGCVWGDDSSDKVQYLDLSEAVRGRLQREEKFGYLETPSGMTLKEAVNLDLYRPDDEWGEIVFTTRRLFSLRKGRFAEAYANYDDD